MDISFLEILSKEFYNKFGARILIYYNFEVQKLVFEIFSGGRISAEQSNWLSGFEAGYFAKLKESK